MNTHISDGDDGPAVMKPTKPSGSKKRRPVKRNVQKKVYVDSDKEENEPIKIKPQSNSSAPSFTKHIYKGASLY